MAFNQPNVAVGAPVAAPLENATLAVLSPATTYAATLANWSSATTPPTTTARYWITGNICHVIVQSKLGTGTISVGSVSVSLPVPMDTTGMISGSTALNGDAGFHDVSASLYFGGLIVMVDSNTVQPLRPLQPATYTPANVGGYSNTTAGTPMTWQTLDELSLAFSYPVA